MTLEQIIAYYVNLLIIQYHNQPNAQATISLLIRQLLADNIFLSVRNGYNIETAVGAQLDIIGKYIGVDRFFTELDLTGYFAFIEYDTDPIYGIDGRVGFADYSNVGTKVGKWLTYDDIVSQTVKLKDSDYRILLKLKILQNNCNDSNKEIDDGLFSLFGVSLWAEDNYNMTMTYYVAPELNALITIANNKGILPKPMGVGLILSQADILITEYGEVITTEDGESILV